MKDKNKDKDWEAISFIKRSTQRKKVLNALDNPSMPKEISEATDIRQSHVSRALKQLKGKSLVEILNPEAKRGRLYQLTEKGEEILEEINDGRAKVRVSDREPEYSVAAEGAVLREKIEDLSDQNTEYEDLRNHIKEVTEDWKDGEISAEEAAEKYEDIRAEMKDME